MKILISETKYTTCISPIAGARDAHVLTHVKNNKPGVTGIHVSNVEKRFPISLYYTFS